MRPGVVDKRDAPSNGAARLCKSEAASALVFKRATIHDSMAWGASARLTSNADRVE